MGVGRAVCLARYLLFNAYIRVHVHRECKLKRGCFSARLAVIDCLRLNTRQEGGTQHAHCQWEYNPSGSTTLQTHLEVFSYVEWRRQWHPTPVLLPGKSHGRRSLVGCSPWGREESETTEQLHFHFSLSCIGEGNGTPLQHSCLENPRDGGAWWAAVYGVAQSWTRLKRLSSSSCVEIAYTPDPTISFLNTHPAHVHRMFKYVYSVPYWLIWSRI